MQTERETNDVTPEALTIPEGRAKVHAAMERFTATTAEVADLAGSLLEEWAAELALAMSEVNAEFGPDLDDLLRAIQGREEAQEAMLRAIAGR